MKPVIVIFAPTACGKTALATEMFGRSSLSCFKGKGEVISADSQAVYKGLDIGTAKPTPEEQKEIPHHLVDIIEPDRQFGVGNFITKADDLCTEILERKKIPLVVGGTGFYIRNFLLGLPVTPESNPLIREQLKEKLQRVGKEEMYAELKHVDPDSAWKINKNDAYRICRALEVYYTSGKPLSSYSLPDSLRKKFDFLTIILNRNKDELYERIDARVEKMFENGLAQEVEHLKEKGFTAESPGMKAIGYSEFFIEGLTKNQIKEKIKSDSHHYAKKQYTFMRGIPEAVTVDADDKEKIFSLISGFCRQVPFLS